jgi:chromosomal replication initiator protein
MLAGVDDNEVSLSLPNRFLRDWVNTNYGDRLTALWRVESPQIRQVRVIVATPERRDAAG